MGSVGQLPSLPSGAGLAGTASWGAAVGGVLLLAAATLTIAPDEDHPVEALVDHLAAHGYRRVDLVSEVGEYTVRGGVFDLFPPGEAAPLRLDLTFTLAAIELQLGEWSAAVGRLERAVTETPTIGEAHWRLALQFERRTVQKQYAALVEGTVQLDGDVITDVGFVGQGCAISQA